MTTGQRAVRNPARAITAVAEIPRATGTDGRVLGIEVTRIRCYEKNPRQCQNPEYDRIKASIQAVGLDQPLIITQRPGDPDYIVHAGGNTRLQILKELFEATGDERFYRVDCRVVAWPGESGVLLAHLRENELRGHLTFIERARAVFAVRDLLAEELALKTISVRQLEGLLKERGYGINTGLLSQMRYSVAVLLPLMPVSLRAGLGKLQVQRIRNLEKVAREVWQRHEIGNDSDFEGVFGALCRRYDGQDWQYDQLQQAIEVEIAEALETSIQAIRIEFECRLCGREPEIPAFVEIDETNSEVFPVAARDEPATPSAAEIAAAASLTASRADAGRVAEVVDAAASGRALDLAIELPCDTEDSRYEVFGQPRGLIPLELLRKRAFQLASRLAERQGLSDLIAPWSDAGLGYVVRDVPGPSQTEALDADRLAEAPTVWWQLVSFAEMTEIPVTRLAILLDEDSLLRKALESGTMQGLADRVWQVEPAHWGERFWRTLSQEDWLNWLALVHNYRELHRMARRSDVSLWDTPT